jgi:hypothetical protein
MSKIGQFAVIENKAQWQQYQEELKTDLASKQNTETHALEFPNDPKKYPCLVAATFAKPGPIYHGELSFSHVICCFVYIKDAEALLNAQQATKNALELQPKIKSTSKKTEYMPSPLATLVLSLLMELKSLGAIKKERLLETIKKVKKWLANNFESISDNPTNLDLILDIFEKDLEQD